MVVVGGDGGVYIGDVLLFGECIVGELLLMLLFEMWGINVLLLLIVLDGE